MIDVITYAVQQEILAYMGSRPCTVMEKTDFLTKEMPSYQMPFILWEEEGGDETAQMLGGMTMCEFDIYLSIYSYQPDVYGSDPTTLSAQNKAILDELRTHFSNFTVWLSAEMAAAFNSLGIKWTLTRVHKAPHLDHPDGLVKGHQIIFSTISWDDGTSEAPDADAVPFVSLSQTGGPVSGNQMP